MPLTNCLMFAACCEARRKLCRSNANCFSSLLSSVPACWLVTEASWALQRISHSAASDTTHATRNTFILVDFFISLAPRRSDTPDRKDDFLWYKCARYCEFASDYVYLSERSHRSIHWNVGRGWSWYCSIAQLTAHMASIIFTFGWFTIPDLHCYYIPKVSFDSLYCYATAKADVRLHDSRLIRELQFRDLTLITKLCFWCWNGRLHSLDWTTEGLCQHNFQHNGSQTNVSVTEHNSSI